MTQEQARIVKSWVSVIAYAATVRFDGDAAYRITVGLVRRCRELGLL